MVMQYLLLIVLICIPLMLCAKPIILNMTTKHPQVGEEHEEFQGVAHGDEDDNFQAVNKNQLSLKDDFDLASNLRAIAAAQADLHGGNHGFGELMIH